MGGKSVPEEPRGTKCESLFHALCCHNQMDDVCSGKDRTYWHVTKTKVELNKNFRRPLLSCKDKVTIKDCKEVPRGGKSWHRGVQGAFAAPYHPWLRVC